MRAPLTDRQNETLEFIRGYIRLHHRPPCYKEIGENLGINSTNGVARLICRLEDKGYLKRDKHKARTITLIDEQDDLFGVQASPRVMVASRTMWNKPEALRKQARGYLIVDSNLLRHADPDECLIIQASDDGMNSDGIRKKDLVIVREQDASRLPPNSLVAVISEDAFIVRRYSLSNGLIHLHAADRSYNKDPFPPGAPNYHLIGRVIALIRQF